MAGERRDSVAAARGPHSQRQRGPMCVMAGMASAVGCSWKRHDGGQKLGPGRKVMLCSPLGGNVDGL